MKEKIIALVEDLTPELNTLSKEIYDNPELGNEEVIACKLHTDLLRKHGFEVIENFSGVKTGFKGIYDSQKDGLTIAFLAEYDALPGIGHGCAHNLLGTVSTGAGIVLKQLIDEIGGKVVVFGTPAEETSGAKVTYAENGEFDDVSIALIAHPSNKYSKSGSSLALEPVQFEFFGKTSHAAADPEKGINALDAAIQTFNMVNALREHIKSDSRVHGVIIEGGKAANVVPDYAKVQFYIRSKTKTYNEQLLEKIKNCARAASMAMGTELTITKYEFSYDNMITNQILSELFTKHIEDMTGIKVEEASENTGSIDMGQVSQICPAIHPSFDITNNNDSIAGHTVEMAASTLTDYAKIQMQHTISALVLTAVDVMKDEGLYNKIKEEFENTEK